MRARTLLVTSVTACCLGCSSEPTTQGFEEPVRVPGGQFREGQLPGLPPLTSDQIAEGERPVSPTVTVAEGAAGILLLGDAARVLRGRVTGDAVAMAFRFEDLGSGYWIEPARGPDPVAEGEYSWSFRAEFLRGLPSGPHRLLFAGLGANGESGTQLDATICVASEVPDNGNACLPGARPPSLVVSLAWDTNVDLDLAVLTPEGQLVDAQNPVTLLDDGAPAPGAGVLDRDSNAACVVEGRRRENFVYEEAPPSGAYNVYANLFDPCGEQGVRFSVSVFVPETGASEGTYRQVEVYRKAGILLASQANGGASVGLRVAEFLVP